MDSVESSPSVASTRTAVAAISASGCSVKRREPSEGVENDKVPSELVHSPLTHTHSDVNGDGDSKVGATKRHCQRLRSTTPTNVLKQDEEELAWHSIPDDVMTQIMLAATTDPKE